MAQLGETFDANVVEPNQPFEVLPAGKYKVQIIASEMRPTNDGNGSYLWLEMDILEGEYQGRKFWDRLNLNNPSEQAVQIAQRTLSALCHACGKLVVSDSEDLHFIPIIAHVKVRPGTVKELPSGERREYSASNSIGGYSAADGSAPPAAQPRAAGTPGRAVAPAAAPVDKPWKQRRAS